MVNERGHKQKILDAALEIILSKGFPATRVDEICKAAGATKGSFYHHFESKDALAHVLIDRYFAGVVEAACPPGAPEGEGLEPFEAFMENFIRVSKGPLLRNGCLLGSFALDLSETHPEIREKIDRRLVELTDVVEKLIRAAGTRSGATRPKALARQFVSVLQGSIVMAKAAGDHGRVAEAMRCYRDLVLSTLQD